MSKKAVAKAVAMLCHAFMGESDANGTDARKAVVVTCHLLCGEDPEAGKRMFAEVLEEFDKAGQEYLTWRFGDLLEELGMGDLIKDLSTNADKDWEPEDMYSKVIH